MRISICLALLVLAISVPDADEVKALEGYYDFSKDFKMYSGYLVLQ